VPNLVLSGITVTRNNEFCFSDSACQEITSSHPLLARRWSSSTTEDDEEKAFVYESPLGSVVTKLRTVSLATGIIGSIGLPIVVAVKGDLPAAGMLMMGMAFVTGTLASTAAIHFVFHPYVYSIEQIPVRKCHYQKKANPEGTQDDRTISCEPKKKKDVLLKAISRSLFLTQVETVFDPAADVLPYKGIRPLCNFTAKGVPLYVHPEYLYDQALRKEMNLDKGNAKLAKENPDDFL